MKAVFFTICLRSVNLAQGCGGGRGGCEGCEREGGFLQDGNRLARKGPCGCCAARGAAGENELCACDL